MHYCFHRSASSTTLTAVRQTLRRGASWLTRDARLALNWLTVKSSWIICCIGVLVINPSPKWIESVPIRGSKDMSSKFAGLQLFCQACRKESATQEGPKKKAKCMTCWHIFVHSMHLPWGVKTGRNVTAESSTWQEYYSSQKQEKGKWTLEIGMSDAIF